jgi:nucleoside-triphosphatase THEP1
MDTIDRELLHELQEYIGRCDPESPINWQTEAALYEPFDQGVRGSDTLSCVDELARTIMQREAKGQTCQLFTGFPGTGKTTELRRLRTLLEERKDVPTYVLYIDFEEFIDIYSPISITDILRVLAYSLDRAATIEAAIKAGNLDPDNVKVKYLERLFDLVSGVDAEIKQIGFATYGMELMLEIKNNPNFRQRTNQALNLRFQVFAKEAHDMMRDALRRLKAATTSQDVVIIADGLEKLTYLQDEDREKAEAAAEMTFATHAKLMRLPAPVIYTFPFWLRFRVPQLGALYDGEPRVLPMVKINDRNGRPSVEGREKLIALVNRRMPVERVFGSASAGTLIRIIEASGGFFKDLLRFIRDSLTLTSELPLTAEHCEYIIDRTRQAIGRAIWTPDAHILAEIARTKELPKGDGSKRATFSRLFINHLVLTYLNGEEWYDVHPLVRRVPEVRDLIAAQKSVVTQVR